MIPIARPLIGEEEHRAVAAVLESGMLAQGPRVKEFEELFAAFCGVKYAVATSSGTTALHIALLSHGIGPGDEVITTPLTFIASANSVLFTGARPVFVDIEADSFNIDPSLIEEKITRFTKAIMPVHLYGNPCNMRAIMEIAEKYSLVIIEDACQAHGASIIGRKVGSFGTGCFSFYPTKNMTSGEGGMITTNDSEIAEHARLVRQHGEQQQYHDILGFNFRMTDIHAAIGIVQLGKLVEFNETRIANARFFNEHLVGVSVPTVREGYHHVFHLYTIRTTNRDALARKLKDRGVGTKVYYPVPVHQQRIYISKEYRTSLPEAERTANEILSLPVHPGLTKSDLKKIVTEVHACLKPR